MPGTCVFCEIIKKEKPGFIVDEDEQILTFLDNRPLFYRHCLLVPKYHYETLPDIPPDLVGPLFQKVQLMARVVKEVMQSQGTFIAMNNTVSQSVPHLHIHIVPSTRGDGLKGFFSPRKRYQSDEQMQDICNRINEGLKLNQ